MKEPANESSDQCPPERSSKGPIDFRALNESALEALPEVLSDFLDLDIKIQGEEIQMLNPKRRDNDFGSFSVNASTGRWADFAEMDAGEKASGGDIISLVAYVKSSKQIDAARALAKFLDGANARPVDPPLSVGPDTPTAQPEAQAPAHAGHVLPPMPQEIGAAAPVHHSPARAGETLPPIPISLGHGTATHYVYNDAIGRALAAVSRYDSGGKKTFRQWTLKRSEAGGLAWAAEAPPVPRPLFQLDQLKARPDAPVLICEGEKTALAAARLYPQVVTTTTLAGAKSPAKSDFSPLRGRIVYVAPDNDEAGQGYKDKVVRLATDAGARVIGILKIADPAFCVDSQGNPRQVPAGYDLAEAEAEGWTAERMKALGTSIWEVQQPPLMATVTPGAPEPLKVAGTKTQANGKPDPGVSLAEHCAYLASALFGGKLLHDGSGFRTYRDGYWPMLDPRVDVDKQIANYLGNKASTQMINALTSLLATTHACLPDDFQEARQLICCTNGTLDPRTGELLAHSHDHLLSNRLNVAWDAEANCPLWLQTLDEIFAPDADKTEKITLLQEFTGYCLIPDTSMHKFLWMVGGGGNGKSLVLKVLEEVVGRHNVSHAQIDRLQDKFVRAELKDKLLNISSEMSAEATIADGYLKQIVSGDTLEAERKYQPSFSFKPTVRMVGATNVLPRLLDHSDGFFRRAIFLTFNRRFTEQEQDRAREGNLLKELPGILVWAVVGLQALLARGSFNVPSSSVAALDVYRLESNPVQQFMDECTTRTTNPSEFTGAQDLYDAFDRWRERHGYSKLNASSLKNRLEALRYISTRTNAGRQWNVVLNGPGNGWGLPAANPTQTATSMAFFYRV